MVLEEGVASHPVPQHVDLGLFTDHLGPEHELEHRHGEAAVVAAPGVLMLLVNVKLDMDLIIPVDGPGK